MTDVNLNLWVIPLLPLAGAAINGLFGRRFNNKMVSFVALFFTAASFAWAVWATVQWWPHTEPYMKNLGDWIWAGGTGSGRATSMRRLAFISTVFPLSWCWWSPA